MALQPYGTNRQPNRFDCPGSHTTVFASMRMAAGVLLLLLGLILLIGLILVFIAGNIPGLFLAIYLLETLCAVFFVTGGVFCLKRRYWKVCFSSAFVAVVIMILYLTGPLDTASWLDWFVIITGVFPIIFVSLRKTEWQHPLATNG